MDTQQTHNRKIAALATAVASSLLLVACGGGSGGGSSTPSKKEQTITFPAIETMAVGDSETLAATASSKLAVIYASTTPEICSVSKAEGDKKDTFMVKALAAGDCTITANQAGDSSFTAAKAVSITTPIVGTELTVNVPETIEPDAANTTITISGKPVSDNLTAMLGDAKLTTKSMGKYKAEVTVTSEDIAKVGMVGDVILTIKDGDKVVKEQMVNIALPKATGDSFTVKKTGYTECANLDDNHIDCTNKEKLGEGEDGYYNTNQDGEVQAGADNNYIKVAHKTDKATEYCVYDLVTGLTWEQKTDSGLQANSHKYSWYNGTLGKEISRLDEGKAKADTICKGSLDKCNTEVYLKTLNDMNYCGHNDWRLPTQQELVGIRDFGKVKVDSPFTNPIFNLVHVPDNGNSSMQDEAYTTQSISSNGGSVAIVNFSSDILITGLRPIKGGANFVIAVRSDTK